MAEVDSRDNFYSQFEGKIVLHDRTIEYAHSREPFSDWDSSKKSYANRAIALFTLFPLGYDLFHRWVNDIDWWKNSQFLNVKLRPDDPVHYLHYVEFLFVEKPAQFWILFDHYNWPSREEAMRNKGIPKDFCLDCCHLERFCDCDDSEEEESGDDMEEEALQSSPPGPEKLGDTVPNPIPSELRDIKPKLKRSKTNK